MTQRPISPALSQPLVLQCVDRRGRALELRAEFGYEPSDPYAVRITFPAPGADVRWLMSREMLLLGLTEPAGLGDLQAWPGTDRAGRAVVVLEFNSPDGRLVARARSAEVHRFLSRTLTAVPVGTEGDHLDLGELVDDLLGRSHPQ